MQDLGILEILVTLFIFFYLSRPFFKGLWNIQGLVMLPSLALFTLVGIFFAYGFRPELVPLLVCILIINIKNSSEFFGMFTKLRNNDYLETGIIPFLILFFMMLFSIGTALYFTSDVPSDLTKDNITTITLTNKTDGSEYYVRIYDPKTEEEKQNVIFVMPPVLASIHAVDLLCSQLRDKGYRVAVYSKKGFDIPSVNESGKYFLPDISTAVKMISSLDKPYDLQIQRIADFNFLSDFIREGLKPQRLFFLAYNESCYALKDDQPNFNAPSLFLNDENRYFSFTDIPQKYPIIDYIFSAKAVNKNSDTFNADTVENFFWESQK
ncbi:MAG: hypothetical protein Ta2G_05020 [Termitinemataceae bacterium]|nr:MAG: hypothetical protein Ta2G_05020 [Termitinemataceae bacterium]